MKESFKEFCQDVKLIILILIILSAMFSFRFYLQSSRESDIKYNRCNSELSCMCRDRCSIIYGHSNWDSWLYKNNGECWCMELNDSRKLF